MSASRRKRPSHGRLPVQGRTADSRIDELQPDSVALEHAGATAVVLEGMPREVAQRITAELTIPTIGIGAGPDCDGQILVFHDLVNLSFSVAKFVRQYADAASSFAPRSKAIATMWRSASFPSMRKATTSPKKSDSLSRN